MFFLLIGTRGFERIAAVVRGRCPNCGMEAPQRYWERGTRFTVFLIPLFTFGRRTARECTNCGWMTGVDSGEVHRARSSSSSVGSRWG